MFRAREYKICIIGDSGVGKSCLITYFLTQKFDSNNKVTVGGAYHEKQLFINNEPLHLQIWDTAGQERFRSMTPMYYRNADLIILAYSINSQKSFSNLPGWLLDVQKYHDGDPILSVVGNKSDLEKYRKVETKEGKEYAQSIDATFFEVSAKSGTGISEMFGKIAYQVAETRDRAKQNKTGYINPESQTETNKKGCC
ncbi:ras and ef-hand domain-containing protein [Anaeramoeba flamelloides]|uniref:Ras and ef-hand domain-containing protein n=1 Tax=Anaeramoeba flamelloides TaxID=1746091 RepID=A0AAV7ZAJ4_9EUKA|nr:ras and ef-hand domain-containing protein [Anaeramoeba flamelloides]KAJ6244038.1 ras and ef-hand domain-containing protein [Anaeramoeba flamelloides]